MPATSYAVGDAGHSQFGIAQSKIDQMNPFRFRDGQEAQDLSGCPRRPLTTSQHGSGKRQTAEEPRGPSAVGPGTVARVPAPASCDRSTMRVKHRRWVKTQRYAITVTAEPSRPRRHGAVVRTATAPHDDAVKFPTPASPMGVASRSVSRRAFTCGHSRSRMRNQAVSRLRPLTM